MSFSLSNPFRRLSLLWKIVLSTSVALTILFAVTGWIVQTHVVRTTSVSVNEEVEASFQAYESLWKSRAEMLKSLSLILASMSDVRAAFRTRDQATIRDTAGELWAKISESNALFLVTDPEGRVIASLGGPPVPSIRGDLPVVRTAVGYFSKLQQVTGFLVRDGELFQVVITPVYVDSGHGQDLLNVLVAGYAVDHLVAQHLKESTGGSEFLFLSGGEVFASTLNERAKNYLARHLPSRAPIRGEVHFVSDGVLQYASLNRPLLDISGKPIGQLWILRSFENASKRISALRRYLILMWLLALGAGIFLTYVLARRIVEPVKKLDRAAAEVSRQNYDHLVQVDSEDELGRLAATFNHMCASIQSAREELIRQERISTIGRLSSSIVHDLRNPLAAIYGGAEMLVDAQLSAVQVKRLATNIYRSSRRIQELLQELVDVCRGKTRETEVCRLREVVSAARDSLAAAAEAQSVEIILDVPEYLELAMERARMERVFMNLMANSLEAMPDGGVIRISATAENGSALIDVWDTGPGIRPEVRSRLFQPFVTAGKKNGLGLGLALSRQTVLDHGGDMWVEPEPGPGAHFVIRLPMQKTAAVAEMAVQAVVASR